MLARYSVLYWHRLMVKHVVYVQFQTTVTLFKHTVYTQAISVLADTNQIFGAFIPCWRIKIARTRLWAITNNIDGIIRLGTRVTDDQRTFTTEVWGNASLSVRLCLLLCLIILLLAPPIHTRCFFFTLTPQKITYASMHVYRCAHIYNSHAHTHMCALSEIWSLGSNF